MEFRQLTPGPLAMQLERELAETNVQFPHLHSTAPLPSCSHTSIRTTRNHYDAIHRISSASSILWEQCTPVFVDIDPATFNIDPTKISRYNRPNEGYLGVHVFSNPCDGQAIEQLAAKHNLKVIYDAAHAFGVEVDGKSIFESGPLHCIVSCQSFQYCRKESFIH